MEIERNRRRREGCRAFAVPRRGAAGLAVLCLAGGIAAGFGARSVTAAPWKPITPNALTVSVPSGSRNLLLGLDGTATRPYKDDVYLQTISFGSVTYSRAANSFAGVQAARVVSGRPNVNAEFGDEDTVDDGDPNPFAKANLISPTASVPAWLRESTTPEVQDPALREAFGSVSLVEGTDGEEAPFTYDLIFRRGVMDNDTKADNEPEVLFFERGRNSTWRVQAIIGGTFTNPVLAPNTITIDPSDTYDTGIYIDTIEIAGSQVLGAVGLDSSDFFKNRNSVVPIYGVRIIAEDDSGPDLYGIGSATVAPSQNFVPVPPALTAGTATAVELERVRATGTREGVLIEWRTGSEVDHLGFNVYCGDREARIRLNPSLLPGSAWMAGPGVPMQPGLSYAWWDRSGRSGPYWLEAVDVSGEAVLYGPFWPEWRPDARDAGDRLSPSARHATPTLQAAAAQALAAEHWHYEGQERRTAAPSGFGPALPPDAELSARACLEVPVRVEGWYALSAAELFAAGWPRDADPRGLHLYVGGREVPLFVRSRQPNRLTPEDTIEFYGLGLKSPYSDARSYWLVLEPRPGARLALAFGAPAAGGMPAGSFEERIERTERFVHFSALLNGEEENFFGPVIFGAPVEQNVDLPGLLPGPARLEVVLQGAIDLPEAPDHRVRVLVNGTKVGEAVFDGLARCSAAFPLPAGLLRAGPNRIQLQGVAGPRDLALLDTLRVAYPRAARAVGDALRCTVPAGTRFRINGFRRPDILLIDGTDPEAPVALPGRIEEREGEFSVTVAVPDRPGGPRVLYACTPAAFRRPETLRPRTLGQLRAALAEAAGADLVLIGPREFLAAAAPLARLRREQGLAVAAVEIDAVYAAFSRGEKTPWALRRFCQALGALRPPRGALAARGAGKKPRAGAGAPSRAVLLLGDASIDPLNYLGYGATDLVPTFQITLPNMETPSDDWFVDFDDDGLPEMAIGRVPARSAEEIAAWVAKMLRYDAAAPPAREVLAVVDQKNGYDFAALADALADALPAGVALRTLRREGLAPEAARAALQAVLAREPALVNYFGHGSTDAWAGSLLRNDDVAGLPSGDRLPVWVQMTCYTGRFTMPGADCLSERLLLAPDRGAIAVWAGSGTTIVEGQAPMSMRLHREPGALWTGCTLGEAVARAKAATVDLAARRSWILFGDPTLRLR